MPTLLTSWAHYWDTQLMCLLHRATDSEAKREKTSFVKGKAFNLRWTRFWLHGWPHFYLSLLLFCSSPEKPPPWIRIRRADIKTQSHGTLPTTRSSKSPQVTGPCQLNPVQGEEGEGKNRELAWGASWGETYYRCYQTPRTRTRRTGRKRTPHTRQLIWHQ